MENKTYYFESRSDFDQQIGQIGITVPLLSQGRKSEHTERYSIASFLMNFVDDDLFFFPFKLIHRDKPDFLIETPDKKIGVEATKSVPEQLERARVLMEKHFRGYAKLEPEFFGWDAPDRTNDEILEILSKSQKQLIGQGFSRNSIEEKWIEGITGCLINKTKKLNNSNFEKFDKNWLLIYDNQTRSFLDKEYVRTKIDPFLENYWKEDKEFRFGKIFIESGKYFFHIEPGFLSMKDIIS